MSEKLQYGWLFTLILQLCATIWWAAEQTTHLDELSKKEASIELKLEKINDTMQELRLTVAKYHGGK